jgi:hypothetical protein
MGGLTDEQETFLANLVERARERAKRAWKITEGFSRATVDEAFDSGFGEARLTAVLAVLFDAFFRSERADIRDFPASRRALRMVNRCV